IVSEQDTRSTRERQRFAIDRGSCSVQSSIPRRRCFILEHSDRRGPTVSTPLARVTHSLETSTHLLAVTRALRFALCDGATHHVPTAHRDSRTHLDDDSALGSFESTGRIVEARSCVARLASTPDGCVGPRVDQGGPGGGTARLAAAPSF